MAVSLGDLELAPMFVSSAPPYSNSAYVAIDMGEVYYSSDMGDSDELPDDIDSDRCRSDSRRLGVFVESACLERSHAAVRQ